MRRITALFLSASALLTGGSGRAEEGRFDAQVFRPSAAPRDLVMVRKSEVVGNLSPVIGVYSDLSFDPLVLLNKSTDQKISAVTSRLTITPMAAIGFFNWIDVTLAVPVVAWQDGGNLRGIGTEGSVKSTTLGDLRLSGRVALPYFNRKAEVNKGFGMALTGDLNLPTGDVNAFAGDGVVTGGGSVIADYRFSLGLLVSANVGIWLRPDRQFAGVRIGDMASFGLGAELYIVQRWGLSVVGEVYGYPSLTKFPDAPTQIPAEFLLGARFQGGHGLSITVGGSFGAACSFGAPAFRLWSSITFQPEKSREQEEINRIKAGQEADPDHDGLIGDADLCPNIAGPPESHGCPDQDSDGDGVPDREDACPDLPGISQGKRGCPTAYLEGDQIVIADEIHFADGADIILDESRPVLEHVAELLIEHPELREVQIEEHTDIGEADAHSVNLSQRRVNRVMSYLVEQRRIEPSRLVAEGFGHLEPVADDTNCLGPEEKLTPACRSAKSKNRGVVFRILHRGAPPSRALIGAGSRDAVLPSLDAWMPHRVLPRQGVLPRKRKVLDENTVLPETHVLPDRTGGTLPWHVLPLLSTSPWWLHLEAPKDAPEDATPKDTPKDAPR